MVDARIFLDALKERVDRLYDTQNEHLDQASRIMADSIKKGGVVHVLGSGHSAGFALDMTGREGALIPIHKMNTVDFVLKGGVPLSVFKDTTDIFERKANLSEMFYNLYDIHPEDAFIIISNSGINGIVIDMAIKAKKEGHKLIVITSMEHTTVEACRHPGGKKLYEYGDVVIDNCGPHGDALLPTEQIGKICSISSITGNLIAQSLVGKTIEYLQADNAEVAYVTADPELNKKLLAKYGDRI